MPTSKPRYQGDGRFIRLPYFSQQLKNVLCDFCVSKGIDDAFVEVLLGAASWAIPELADMRRGMTRDELRAERNDLLKTLHGAASKLRSISVELDRLLPVASDPLGTADKIDELIAAIDHADDLTPCKKPNEWLHRIAVEMTLRCIMVMETCDIKPSSTYDDTRQKPSDTLVLLKAIGDDIGLEYSYMTWRHITMEAIKTYNRDTPEN